MLERLLPAHHEPGKSVTTSIAQNLRNPVGCWRSRWIARPDVSRHLVTGSRPAFAWANAVCYWPTLPGGHRD